MSEIRYPRTLHDAAVLTFQLFLPRVCSDLKELPDLHDRRLKACKKLESAETKLLKLATKAIAKSEKKKNKKDDAPAPQVDAESERGEIARWVPTKKRPTHKLGPLVLCC